jgi:hypothetical protein
MEAVIFILVLVAILVSVVSGVWVAIALVSAVGARRRMPAERLQAGEKEGGQDI